MVDEGPSGSIDIRVRETPATCPGDPLPLAVVILLAVLILCCPCILQVRYSYGGERYEVQSLNSQEEAAAVCDLLTSKLSAAFDNLPFCY